MIILSQIVCLQLRRKYGRENLVTSFEYYGSFAAVVIMMKTTAVRRDMLPDLDELLASSFDPGTSDIEEEIGGQENADSFVLDLSAL